MVMILSGAVVGAVAAVTAASIRPHPPIDINMDGSLALVLLFIAAFAAGYHLAAYFGGE